MSRTRGRAMRDGRIDDLLSAAEKLAECVSLDMNGNLVGGKWMGGHGGLISHETMQAADEVRRAVSSIRALSRPTERAVTKAMVEAAAKAVARRWGRDVVWEEDEVVARVALKAALAQEGK